MGLPNRHFAPKLLLITRNSCSDNHHPPRGMDYEGVRRLRTEQEFWDDLHYYTALSAQHYPWPINDCARPTFRTTSNIGLNLGRTFYYALVGIHMSVILSPSHKVVRKANLKNWWRPPQIYVYTVFTYTIYCQLLPVPPQQPTTSSRSRTQSRKRSTMTRMPLTSNPLASSTSVSATRQPPEKAEGEPRVKRKQVETGHIVTPANGKRDIFLLDLMHLLSIPLFSRSARSSAMTGHISFKLLSAEHSMP